MAGGGFPFTLQSTVPFTLVGTAEIYNPANGTFTSTLTLLRARYGLPPEAARR
jgi:hypothetical protein